MLYLVQHGDAVSAEQDPDRPLSERGREDVARVAALLRRAGLRRARIVHSGKTRARETAGILAEAIGIPAGAEAADGLGPNDPVAPWATRAAAGSEALMLVGHLPFMGRLAALLVAGDEGASVVQYRPGSVVCLERAEAGGWQVAWMVRPELLGR